jgi:hypothetical protein
MQLPSLVPAIRFLVRTYNLYVSVEFVRFISYTQSQTFTPAKYFVIENNI